MGQEFFINSQELESKVRQLLPSQGGAGAGFDLSASTQIIPIIDLTESAEGSNVRQDLQTALSLDTVTAFSVTNQTTTIINNTGYFRVFGSAGAIGNTSDTKFTLTDGTTSKIIIDYSTSNGTLAPLGTSTFDFVVFLKAGDSLTATSSASAFSMKGCTRQIADINGVLV